MSQSNNIQLEADQKTASQVMESYKDEDKAEVVGRVVLAALEGKALSNFNKTEIIEALKLLGSHCRIKPRSENVTKLLDERNSQITTNLEVKSVINSLETSENTESTSNAKDVTKLSQEDETPSATQEVCKFYTQKRCRHFKNKSKCKFLHPKKCEVFMKHGSFSRSNPNGCKTKQCTEYHPKLCHSSITTKTCSKAKCTLSHLRGTTFVTKESPERMNSQKHVSKYPKVEQLKQGRSFLDIEGVLQRLETMQMQLNKLTQQSLYQPHPQPQGGQQWYAHYQSQPLPTYPQVQRQGLSHPQSQIVGGNQPQSYCQ